MLTRMQHRLALAAALVVLLLVFAAYGQGEFLVLLADLVSACF